VEDRGSGSKMSMAGLNLMDYFIIISDNGHHSPEEVEPDEIHVNGKTAGFFRLTERA